MFSKTFLVLALTASALAYAQAGPQRAHSATLRRPADRGYLGVGVIELDARAGEGTQAFTHNGVEVKRVDADSPALRRGCTRTTSSWK